MVGYEDCFVVYVLFLFDAVVLKHLQRLFMSAACTAIFVQTVAACVALCRLHCALRLRHLRCQTPPPALPPLPLPPLPDSTTCAALFRLASSTTTAYPDCVAASACVNTNRLLSMTINSYCSAILLSLHALYSAACTAIFAQTVATCAALSRLASSTGCAAAPASSMLPDSTTTAYSDCAGYHLRCQTPPPCAASAPTARYSFHFI